MKHILIFLYRARLKSGWEVWELTCTFECEFEMYPPKLRFPPKDFYARADVYESSVHTNF